MLIDRSKLALAVGTLVVLLGGPLAAEDLETMELFAPAEVGRYGSGPQPRQGYFFTFDGLHWSISKPGAVPIGFPTHRRTLHSPGFEFTNVNGQIIGVVAPIEEIQRNTHGTEPLASEFTSGNRIEFGRVYGRRGWLFSAFRLQDQVQRGFSQDVDVVFADVPVDPTRLDTWHLTGYVATMTGYTDPGLAGTFEENRSGAFYGNFVLAHLPVSFDNLLLENRVETWGVELMYLLRAGQLHRGGFLEFFGGVRYLEINEAFQVNLFGTERLTSDDNPFDVVANWRFAYDAGSDGDPTDTDPATIGPGNILADSNWVTQAENHIIGPQIGARWLRRGGRWTLAAEGRFFAGLNMQNIRNRGVLGSELGAPPPYSFEPDPVNTFPAPGYPYMPLKREPYEFDHVAHIRQWSPGAELRLDLMFQLTHAISVDVGWTGLYLGGIARASAMPDYTISEAGAMGINRTSNDQDVFINGVNVGLKINR
jgi:hypothetical protein